eukprot:7309408-Pyramimonas_sp.AAC.1
MGIRTPAHQSQSINGNPLAHQSQSINGNPRPPMGTSTSMRSFSQSQPLNGNFVGSELRTYLDNIAPSERSKPKWQVPGGLEADLRLGQLVCHVSVAPLLLLVQVAVLLRLPLLGLQRRPARQAQERSGAGSLLRVPPPHACEESDQIVLLMTSFLYGSSCASNGEGAQSTPEPAGPVSLSQTT